MSKNDDLLVAEWGSSPIEWQQTNRDILNRAIAEYNQYVRGESDSIRVVINAIRHAESKLKDENGNYSDTIEKMKTNIDTLMDREWNENIY